MGDYFLKQHNFSTKNPNHWGIEIPKTTEIKGLVTWCRTVTTNNSSFTTKHYLKMFKLVVALAFLAAGKHS
jgi:hypothetical protein